MSIQQLIEEHGVLTAEIKRNKEILKQLYAQRQKASDDITAYMKETGATDLNYQGQLVSLETHERARRQSTKQMRGRLEAALSEFGVIDAAKVAVEVLAVQKRELQTLKIKKSE